MWVGPRLGVVSARRRVSGSRWAKALCSVRHRGWGRLGWDPVLLWAGMWGYVGKVAIRSTIHETKPNAVKCQQNAAGR